MLSVLAQPALADEVSGTAKARDAVTLAMDGARYRLAGVDPFANARCGEATCAAAAEAALARLIEGGSVTCLKLHKVGHGFFLARCRTSSGLDLAKQLLDEGLADLGEGADEAYHAAREQAKAAGKGRWAP
jgi:endonuclease YncB( thermonuclease family)